MKDEARDEGYEYFDKNIRKLSKTSDGLIDPSAKGLEDNDIDAFRHAYVSGVLTQEYNETAADILGRLNEFLTLDLYFNSKDPRGLNMGLWNNSVGRKYGKICKTRQELLESIHNALNSGELITSLDDTRKYEGARSNPENNNKPVIVLREHSTGRNELFFDLTKNKVMTCDDFLTAIEKGKYPAYSIKNIKGKPTPVSKPDSRKTNNLDK